MNPYSGAYVRLCGTSNYTGMGHFHRVFVLWDKRGQRCWLVEDFDGIGPRLELYEYTGNLEVDVNRWMTHRETRKRWPESKESTLRMHGDLSRELAQLEKLIRLPDR